MPFSGSSPSLLSPGVSSTYVSPSSVFERRIARESLGIGAYRSSSWIVASVVSPGPSSSLTTLPTGTPEMRTSACWASCVASPKRIWKR